MEETKYNIVNIRFKLTKQASNCHNYNSLEIVNSSIQHNLFEPSYTGC